MGDLTSQASPSPSTGHAEPKNMADIPGPPPVVVSSRSAATADSMSQAEASLQAQAQPQIAGQQQQHPFASQLDMSRATHPQNAQHAQHGGSRPYNMAPMANALPQIQYRPGQYPVAHQQRYNHPASPPMMPQMPYGHSAGGMSMGMGHQGYYVQQQPPMMQYYAGTQSPSQMQLPPRQNMAYYPQQMMMGQPQAGFYYPQPTQYPSPNQSMSPTPMPRQHHHHHNNSPTTMADPQFQPMNKSKPAVGPRATDEANRTTRGQGQDLQPDVRRSVNNVLTWLLDSTDKRKGAVRGPPRKPKQSGKNYNLHLRYE